MRFLYDYRDISNEPECMFDIANDYGEDGWRWVNPSQVPYHTMTMIFEYRLKKL